MSTKWTPSTKLALAIAHVEEQPPHNGELKTWGTREHLACGRYLVKECATVEKRKVKGADGKESEKQYWLVDPAVLKEEVSKESAFLGYASNALKMLQAAKMVPEKIISKFDDLE